LELATMTQSFRVEGTRYFRLPFVPLLSRMLPAASKAASKISNWVIQNLPPAEHYASGVVMRLRKLGE
jgi:hypothetical protein